MNNILRWYQYFVAAVSLQSVTWAVIALLRNLLTPALNPLSGSIRYATDTMALQLAVIIIALPLFLVHWLWAERSTGPQDGSELEFARPLYLYFMLSAFLIPFLTNSYGFTTSLMRLLFGQTVIIPSFSSQLPDRANLAFTAIPMVVLALLWVYHSRLARSSYGSAPDAAPAAAVRRLYIYLFSAAGLAMSSGGAIAILRWILIQIPDQAIGSGTKVLIDIFGALIVGLPLWILFWRKAQALFMLDSAAEKESILRKFYLYLVIFLGVMSFVTACTIFLAGLIRRMLALEPQEGGGTILSVLIVSAMIWAYHAVVLREDTQQVPEGERQASLRRLYWYLVAGVGLLALLIGIAGLLSLLAGDSPGLVVNSDKEQLAWYTAALLAGFIVWIIPWVKIQKEINEPQPRGLAARLDPVRKLYLYFFLLMATLQFLSGMVFILAQLLSRLFGARTSVWDNNMSFAAASSLLALVIWIYHGYLLNSDRQYIEQANRELAAKVKVIVIDDGRESFTSHLLEKLRADVPGIDLKALSLSAAAIEDNEQDDPPLSPMQMITQADLIVGPWTMISPFMAPDEFDGTLLQAVADSPASRLMVPRPEPGWQWSGIERWDSEKAVEHTANAVKQFVSGEEVHLVRPRSASNIVLIILAVFLVLFLLFAVGLSFT